MKKQIVKSDGKYMRVDDFSPKIVYFNENPLNLTLFVSVQQASDFMEDQRILGNFTGPYEIDEITLP